MRNLQFFKRWRSSRSHYCFAIGDNACQSTPHPYPIQASSKVTPQNGHRPPPSRNEKTCTPSPARSARAVRRHPRHEAWRFLKALSILPPPCISSVRPCTVLVQKVALALRTCSALDLHSTRYSETFFPNPLARRRDKKQAMTEKALSPHVNPSLKTLQLPVSSLLPYDCPFDCGLTQYNSAIQYFPERKITQRELYSLTAESRVRRLTAEDSSTGASPWCARRGPADSGTTRHLA